MSTETPSPKRKKYVRAVGPRLRRLLYLILGAFALLALNGAYLGAVTLAGWVSGESYENYFYLWMFFGHLVLGLLVLLPVIIFGLVHMRNSYNRPNRRAVLAGYSLFAVAILLLVSGIFLVRIEGLFEVRDESVRSVAYWAHVITPFLAVWIYILHRLAGPKIRWRVGATWAGVTAAVAIGLVVFHAQDPRAWNQVGPESGEQYFFPSLARTATGDFIPSDTLMMDSYCQECHPDVHSAWSHSVHRFSSFNNPAYLFSVRGTRKVALERDGDVQAARFCAGCHDPVPFFSGAFDDPNYDDVNDPTAHAGITCTVCHAITHVNSPRGNSDYTIEEPIHYPFAKSENPLLQWVNRQLVKAKPGFHKKTFLKPLHKTAEFCGTCHKVHLPEELNKYKFLRGQNHYDSFLLSGVSGHGVTSFYYPPEAETNCNGCHMPLVPSEDFGARDFDGSGERKVHDHLFPSANTAVPYLVDLGPRAIEAHKKFTEGTVRVDLFGLRRGGEIDGELLAPLRPRVPAVEPGETYLLETVIRTLKLGHLLTQGTADSNELWLDITIKSGDRVIGRSGGVDDSGEVDPWSHFVNAYVLDRHGNRIDRRNAEDIFIPLYNNQIPPGAGDVVHYRFTVPPDVTEPIEAEVALRYRKFDTIYMRYVYGDDYVNTLPVMTIGTDRVVLPLARPDGAAEIDQPDSEIPVWQRWNDYGIGLLRKGSSGSQRGELRQAEHAFRQVGELGRPDGPLNLARVYIKEGRLADAVAALKSAAEHDPPAPPWTVAWFSGVVDQQNGNFDEAIASFQRIITNDFPGVAERGFDFSKDYRVLNALAQTLFEKSSRERGEERRAARDQLLEQARNHYLAVLDLDPENVEAHFGLAQVASRLGDEGTAEKYRALHAKYKPDDNARDKAIAAARASDPAASHAADAIVIYDLQRDGRPERSVLEFAEKERP